MNSCSAGNRLCSPDDGNVKCGFPRYRRCSCSSQEPSIFRPVERWEGGEDGGKKKTYKSVIRKTDRQLGEFPARARIVIEHIRLNSAVDVSRG